MENLRMILPSDVRMIYFGSEDVLKNQEEKEARKSKLHHATMIRRNSEQPINIYLKLANGETVKTQSDVVNFIDDIVLIKGGHFIPVTAILDIE